MFVIPWNTDAPIYYFPFVTIGMIVVNTAVLILEFAYPEQAGEWILVYGQGLHPLQWLTANFMHAGIGHWFANMIFLWGFGLVVEGKLGWWKFLLAYLGLGIVQCAAEQILVQQMRGGSLGASGVIYSLMAISLVWAPKNEMSCVVVMIFYIIRVFTFEISILAFAGIYVVLELVLAWFNGFAMSTPVLHLSGAFWGFAVGIALLKLNLVDCEGWDIFTVIAGREGERRRVLDKSDLGPQRPHPLASKTADALAHMEQLLAQGHAKGALALHEKMCKASANWQLPGPTLLKLIGGLQKENLAKPTVPLMFDYLRRFPETAIRVRLKLAQVLIDDEHRPRRALEVLEEIPQGSLDAKLESSWRQLIARAETMRDDGEMELDDSPE